MLICKFLRGRPSWSLDLQLTRGSFGFKTLKKGVLFYVGLLWKTLNRHVGLSPMGLLSKF